ncbi:hypothetical protein GCM10025875_19680 [Litorihabitans aurantiacus]|uniref:Uncharacterized protein n=1 Tax=Litorihabitans aurantiacus TaxID=1930061 RepID=A0AA38CRJ4_9MICO|nr:hypothetical protein GCM10025875_19680 [Litorihabitans aurantiacus]
MRRDVEVPQARRPRGLEGGAGALVRDLPVEIAQGGRAEGEAGAHEGTPAWENRAIEASSICVPAPGAVGAT